MSDDLITMPLEGHIIEPSQPWIDRAAAIICGSDLVYWRFQDGEAAEFEQFIKEVLRTTAPSP